MQNQSYATRRALREAEYKLRTQLLFAKSDLHKELKTGIIPFIDSGADGFLHLGILGEGGFGVVHKMQHQELGTVAMKRQPIQRKGKPNVAAIMETRLLHAMDNPFILKGYGYFREEDNIILILPYAKYGTYKRLMRIRDELLAKQFYAQLAEALRYLYAAEVTHGDVKPDNILIFEGGHAKLGDFGIARCETDGLLTMYGTRRYLPPELILGKSHGSTADWWAFGVMLYEQLMGRHPYIESGQSAEVLKEILLNPLRSLEKMTDVVTGDAEDLIRQTLEKDPWRRAGKNQESIEAIMNHGWFRGVNFSLFLDPAYVIPEFQKLELPEVECYQDLPMQISSE